MKDHKLIWDDEGIISRSLLNSIVKSFAMSTSLFIRSGFCICIGLFIFHESSAQFFDKLKKTVKDVSNSTKKINTDVDNVKKNLKKTSGEIDKMEKTTGIGKKNIPKTEKEKNDSIAALSKMIGSNEELVYYNDFSFEDNIWKSYDNRSTSRPLKTEVNDDGTYSINNGTSNPVWSVKELGLDLNRDFIIETSVALIAGSESDNFGINFAQRGNYYPNNAVGINLKGYFSIFERQASTRVNNFVEFTSSESIIKTKGAFNKIRMEKIGRKIRLFINDVYVNENISWNKPVQFYGNYLGFYAGPSQEVKANYFIVKYLNGETGTDRQSASGKANAKPPVIRITEPGLSAGNNKINYSGKSIIISGNVSSEDAVYLLEVNGKEVPLDEKGNFTTYYPLESGLNKISIVAKDGNAKPGVYELSVNQNDAPQKAPGAEVARGIKKDEKSTNGAITVGNYYALVIAAQNYKDPYFPVLSGPINDASSLIEVLRDNYGFDEKRILFVKDPTRVDLFRSLDSVRKLVTSNDNVLIFYAGHGDWKDEYKEGYWAPVDAGSSSQYSMISNAEIKRAIYAINSKHTLLITDACFAGGLLVSRSGLAEASKAINEIYKLNSRKAITSGTLTVVPDKSVFMEYLLKRLRNNQEKYLTALTLFSSFSQAVTNNSPNGQLPQYGAIQQTGDEGGDFIFIKK
jgi:hypothetical protein